MKIKRLFCQYFPMKRLNFKESNFQPIFYQKSERKRLTKRDFILAYSPVSVYMITYLSFFDLFNPMHQINIVGLGTFGTYTLIKILQKQQRVISSFLINQDVDTFIIKCDKEAINQRKIDLIKQEQDISIDVQDKIFSLQFKKSHIQEFSFLYTQNFKVKNQEDLSENEIFQQKIQIQQQLEQDMLIIVLNIKDDLLDFYIKIDQNQLKEFNDYLIAMGKKQQIMIKK